MMKIYISLPLLVCMLCLHARLFYPEVHSNKNYERPAHKAYGFGKPDKEGFVNLFDGKSLKGWEGDPTYWKMEGGTLVGEITPATLLTRNSFIIWRGGITEDFELKTLFRVSEKGNSGINYRSVEVQGIPFALKGYQSDIDGAKMYTGSNYEERGRTTLAAQGQKVMVNTPDADADSLRRYIKNNAWQLTQVTERWNSDSLKKVIKTNDWNECHLVVKGNRMQHYINGVLMSDVTDNDVVNRNLKGLLGVQVHVGPPMKIEYRNFRLKQLN
ncbi:MAG: 3-keto-disaccharide hydrolase [Agriterribacter sp.]